MRKQSEGLGHSDSRKRVQNIFEEEEKLSKAFQLSNFYTNHRLNIAELKHRLEQFKKTQGTLPGIKNYQTPQKSKPLQIFNQVLPEDLEKEEVNENSTAKFIHNSQRQRKAAISHKLMGRMGRNYQNSIFPTKQNSSEKAAIGTVNIQSSEQSVQRRQETKQPNYRIVREIRKTRYDSKTKNSFGPRHIQSGEPLRNISIINRLNAKIQNSRAEKTDYSKCSHNSFNQSWQEIGVEGRIDVTTVDHLNWLQKQIHNLWEHYQLLTKILLGLREGSRQEKNTIVKYVEDICSDKFQFVRELLTAIQKENPVKSQASFMKRLKKAIIQSKLYENLSLVYVSLDICLKLQPDSNLVNFVGYCCSNIIFLLRFVELCHNLAHHLNFSAHTQNILAVITQFQLESYKSGIERMGDLVLRIEHNNQVISRAQAKICGKMDKDFQYTIVSFLKNVDLDTKPLLQYAHYIYEFFAFHLAKIGVVGQFSFVEMAPSPYLNLRKQKTVVIEPWQVIFAYRGENTYIRAYSQSFISQIGRYCNVVYWTDQMPDRIDDLLKKIPSGSSLYRYHCRYENERFLKLLWRIGCDVDNTIIIDREEANFRYDREMGLELPWKGKSKDSKFIELMNALLPLLANSSLSLRKGFPSVKEKFITEQKKSKSHKRKMEMKTSYNQTRTESLYPKHLYRK